MRYALKKARLQSLVLTNRNSIQRLLKVDEQARCCDVRNQIQGFVPFQKPFNSRCCRNQMKECALTLGDLLVYGMNREKSAEIVVVGW